MRRVTFTAFALALAFGLIVVQPSQATPVPWSNASGEATNFYWTNGQNATGYFGNPTLVGDNAFRFTPTGFEASAQDGSTMQVGDVASWDVSAKDGVTFSEIRLTQRGSWSIAGEATNNRVRVDGLFTVTHNGVGPPIPPESRFFESTTSGSGSWMFSNIVLDLAPALEPTSLHISLDDGLLAFSGGAGNTCSIRLSYDITDFVVTIVPEPATLTMLVVGLLALVRRR